VKDSDRWAHNSYITQRSDNDEECTLTHQDDPYYIPFFVDPEEEPLPAIFVDTGIYDTGPDDMPFVSSPYPNGPWDQGGEILYADDCGPAFDGSRPGTCVLSLEYGNTIMGMSKGGVLHSGKVLYLVVGGFTGKIHSEGCVQFHGDPI
jgi:hypothetical protein